MKIHVQDNIYIESDDRQFIIKKYGKKDKNGNDTYTSLGYFTTLESVCKYLIRLKVFESQATTIKELLDDYRRIEKEIKQLIF